jgi:hypothetical protein
VELLEGGAEAPATITEGTQAALPHRIADEWSIITEVLERELSDQPSVLRRVLVALANAHGSGGRSTLAAGDSV